MALRGGVWRCFMVFVALCGGASWHCCSFQLRGGNEFLPAPETLEVGGRVAVLPSGAWSCKNGKRKADNTSPPPAKKMKTDDVISASGRRARNESKPRARRKQYLETSRWNSAEAAGTLLASLDFSPFQRKKDKEWFRCTYHSRWPSCKKMAYLKQNGAKWCVHEEAGTSGRPHRHPPEEEQFSRGLPLEGMRVIRRILAHHPDASPQSIYEETISTNGVLRRLAASGRYDLKRVARFIRHARETAHMAGDHPRQGGVPRPQSAGILPPALPATVPASPSLLPRPPPPFTPPPVPGPYTSPPQQQQQAGGGDLGPHVPACFLPLEVEGTEGPASMPLRLCP